MKKNILIIERNKETALYYEEILCAEDYDIHQVTSDMELLRYAFTIPDVFIIGSRFLNLNAVEICQHLRANAFTKNVPVVIVSSALEIETLRSYGGVAAFIEKPFIPEKFRTIIRQCLNGDSTAAVSIL